MTTTADGWQIRAHTLPIGQWGRRLHGPWRVLFQDINTGMVGASKPTPYLEAALRTLIEGGLPRRGYRSVVVDDDGWIVFGCSTDPEFISSVGHDCWWGCEIGFAMVESTGLVEPVDLAIWETYARETSDKEDWWA
jgi:hypothetical protein